MHDGHTSTDWVISLPTPSPGINVTEYTPPSEFDSQHHRGCDGERQSSHLVGACERDDRAGKRDRRCGRRAEGRRAESTVRSDRARGEHHGRVYMPWAGPSRRQRRGLLPSESQPDCRRRRIRFRSRSARTAADEGKGAYSRRVERCPREGRLGRAGEDHSKVGEVRVQEEREGGSQRHRATTSSAMVATAFLRTAARSAAAASPRSARAFHVSCPSLLRSSPRRLSCSCPDQPFSPSSWTDLASRLVCHAVWLCRSQRVKWRLQRDPHPRRRCVLALCSACNRS